MERLRRKSSLRPAKADDDQVTQAATDVHSTCGSGFSGMRPNSGIESSVSGTRSAASEESRIGEGTFYKLSNHTVFALIPTTLIVLSRGENGSPATPTRL